MKKLIKLTFILWAVLFLVSCSKDDEVEEPDDHNDEELITTMTLTFTNQATGAERVFKFEDLDGEGGNAPTIDAIDLAAGQSYKLNITVANDLENEDITPEIREEDDEHQFFFTGTSVGSLLTITYADSDGDGNPIGLENDVLTFSNGTGNLTVTLRHEPDKNAAGVSSGDITNAGGETDIEVTFDVSVN